MGRKVCERPQTLKTPENESIHDLSIIMEREKSRVQCLSRGGKGIRRRRKSWGCYVRQGGVCGHHERRAGKKKGHKNLKPK